jgi:hypothetical protein
MLLCNNTAIRRARLIKDAGQARAGLSVRPYGPILARMSEADDVARRFIAIWSDYLTALTADPKMAEPLHRWLSLVAAAMPGSVAREAGPSGSARSPADATAPAGASGERDAAVADLARRLDELELRLAALERRRRTVAGARPGSRTARR